MRNNPLRVDWGKLDDTDYSEGADGFIKIAPELEAVVFDSGR